MDRPQPYLFAALLMGVLALGGGLSVDGSGLRPTVVAAVITAAAPLAAFALRRGDPLPYVRASEGYLWASGLSPTAAHVT